jgi:hypothetical protein
MSARRTKAWAASLRFAAQAFDAFMLVAINAFWGVVLTAHLWGR